MNVAVKEANGVAEYDEFRAKINEVKEACNFIPDVTTDEGYEKSKRVALDVGKILTALEKRRKELKADALAFGRKVDNEAKSIAEELSEFQLPHKEAYKELDNLRKQREADRKAQLQERVDNLRNLPDVMRDASSEEIKAALEDVSAEECLDFYEFTEQALKARNASKEALSKLFGERLKEEKEKAELERLRKAEAERKQKEHEERIAREAKESAEREAQAAIKREKQVRENAERAVREAEEKAKRDVEAAKQRAVEEAQRAVEAERKRQEDEAAKAAEIEAKRQANKAHQRRINKEALSDLQGIISDEGLAKSVIAAIAKGEISHISINY